jgi:hypothetical protein
MRSLATYIVCVYAMALTSCTTSTNDQTTTNNVRVGNHFIDAFYSFNRDSLQSLLANAEASQTEILYYQKWAECANYKVLARSTYFEKNDSTLILPVTVKDDLMNALGIDFNVTDTFHVIIQHGKILSIKTSSNDPKEYYEAKEWVKKNRPEFVEKACKGIWEGGPTPCECVLGMINGFRDFVKESKFTN